MSEMGLSGCVSDEWRIKKKKTFWCTSIFFERHWFSVTLRPWAGSPWRRARAIEKLTAPGWQKSRRNGTRRNKSSFASSLNGRTFKQKAPPVKVIKCLKKALVHWKDLMVGNAGNGMKCINKMEISWSVYVFMHLPARVSMWLAGDLQGVFCHCPGDLWDWL